METATKIAWAIDPMHSEIQFKVKHLVISTVSGSFGIFSGSVESDSDDFNGARVQFEADVDSITTGNGDRDNHLKSDDFFAAAEFPKLSFDGALKAKGDDYVLEGDMQIRGQKHPVSLDVEYGGTATDPYGNVKSGFEINGKINRKDYGLTWSAMTEAGGMVVSDEVKLHLNVQLARV